MRLQPVVANLKIVTHQLGRSKMTSPGKGRREVNKNDSLFQIANSIVFTVTGEGGRYGNGHFCGDIIFMAPNLHVRHHHHNTF